MEESRPAGEVISWDIFQASFLAEFQPESLRVRRAFEFEALTYDSCGSIDAYARRFMELCKYAPTLVSTDALKVQRFVRGLPWSMQELLVSQLDLPFSSVVDRARHLEDIRRARDGDLMGEVGKKARTESISS